MYLPLLMLSVLMIGCSSVRPTNLGVKEGLLAPCPTTPNCVLSQSVDQEHAIAPLPYRENASDTISHLKKVILAMKRTEIVVATGSYLHAEFTSAVFRFVDDVEFLCDDRAKLIHVRSASRVGRSDFGVNRKRVEEIRARWNASGK
jgi:uncharacterized protein (DUF1499 family)